MEALSSSPHVLCAIVAECTPHRWFAPYYAVTRLVEQVDPTTALLDLGTCTAHEAWQVSAHLLAQLRHEGTMAYGALASHGTLAHLAALQQPAGRPLRYITDEECRSFLASTPIAVLGALHPRGMFTSELLARLTAYGLTTLGKVARLNVQAMQHQFGEAGGQLAQIARGEALRPVQPTPVPQYHTVALRLPAEGLPVVQLAEALPTVWPRLALWLARTGYAVGELRLRLGWARGGEQTQRRLLNTPTTEVARLQREGERLLARLVGSQEAPVEALVSTCQVTVARYAAPLPHQPALWAPSARQQALDQVIAGLAARHGQPVVFQASLSPLALCAQDRFVLRPYGSLVRREPTTPQRAQVVGDWEAFTPQLHWW